MDDELKQNPGYAREGKYHLSEVNYVTSKDIDFYLQSCPACGKHLALDPSSPDGDMYYCLYGCHRRFWIDFD